ncbi:MAG: hypothetical protein LBF22_07215 [Deltaproteobacteria bacterium]|jgi:hypothetical protein|nr:hypothetical protein [Deltaproteobacteria bacterium]
MPEKIISKDPALSALEHVTIQPAAKIKDHLYGREINVPQIHQDVKKYFSALIDDLKNNKYRGNPPVFPVVGLAGSGKTHLLKDFYEATIAKNGFFIALELPNLDNYFNLLNISVLQTLNHEIQNRPHYLLRLINNILIFADFSSIPKDIFTFFVKQSPLSINKMVDNIVKKLCILLPDKKSFILNNEDVIRSIFHLLSPDITIHELATAFLSNDDYYEDYTKSQIKFKTNSLKPEDIYYTLTFLMSLNGSFSVVALDQLDSLLKNVQISQINQNLTFEDIFKKKVMDLAIFFSRLIKNASRSGLVITVLQDVWQKMLTKIPSTHIDRIFLKPKILDPLKNTDYIKNLVKAILSPAYLKEGFKPPYPTWPFPEAFFQKYQGAYIRHILEAISAHIQDILSLERPLEWGNTLPQPTYPLEIANVFQDSLNQKRAHLLKNPEKAQPWLTTLEAFFACLALEQDLDAPKSLSYSYIPRKSRKNSELLFKVQYQINTIAKRSLFIVILLEKNSNSFRSQLQTALLHSGITLSDSSRKLIAIRFESLPGGQVTHEAVTKLFNLGGKIYAPPDSTLNALLSLTLILEKYPKTWGAWARHMLPTKSVGFLVEELNWLMQE